MPASIKTIDEFYTAIDKYLETTSNKERAAQVMIGNILGRLTSDEIAAVLGTTITKAVHHAAQTSAESEDADD